MAYSIIYARFYAWRQRLSLGASLIWRFSPNRRYFLAFGLFQLVAWWQTVTVYRLAGVDRLVLHYKVNFGIDRVGDPAQIFSYPVFSLLILLFDLIILLLLSRHKSFHAFSHLLMSAAVAFSAFVCLALFSIYLINFR